MPKPNKTVVFVQTGIRRKKMFYLYVELDCQFFLLLQHAKKASQIVNFCTKNKLFSLKVLLECMIAQASSTSY